MILIPSNLYSASARPRWAMDPDADVDEMDGRQMPARVPGTMKPAHSAHNGLDNVASGLAAIWDLGSHVPHSAHSPCGEPHIQVRDPVTPGSTATSRCPM